MSSNFNRAFKNIAPLISNTPLLEIKFRYKGKPCRIFAKAEFYNLTGSIKDRIAFHVLKSAVKSGALKEGDTIAEATSGNTGIAFAALGSALGNPVVIFMPDWMSSERKNLIKAYGADIRLVSREEGGFLGSIAQSEKFAEGGNVFLPKQFSNEDNSLAHYNTTGFEIGEQLKKLSLVPDAVVAGVGTGGTIMGIGRRLRDYNPDVKIHPLEPANSPTLSTGYKVGSHRIQGISDDFIPEILKLSEIDDVVSVDDGDAIILAQMLSKKLGIGVGISSGANFIGAVIAQQKLNDDSIVVTVFSDDSKKYLSTDFVNEIPVKEGYYSSDIELLEMTAHPSL